MNAGTKVTYVPGGLLGGKLAHDCGTSRAIGYFLEAVVCVAPFCKRPLQLTLSGITNDEIDPAVSNCPAMHLCSNVLPSSITELSFACACL